MYSSGGDWTFSRVAENRRGRKRTRKSSHFLIGTLGFAWVLSQYRVMPLRDYKFSPPKLPSLWTFQMLSFPHVLSVDHRHLNSFWETAPCALRGASFLCLFSSMALSKTLRTESEPNSVNKGGVTCSIPLIVRTDEVLCWCSQNLANKGNRARAM